MFNDDKELKRAKKRGRIVRTAVWSIGLGIGLLAARFIAPLIAGESEMANSGFSGFGLALLGYGVALLAALAFLRDKASFVCSVITYFIMPAVLLWLMTGLS